MIIATHLGIGLYPDSIVYIGTARSILNGDGLRFLNDMGQIAPVTQYPPLYSLMIAALGVLGLDPLDGARWISLCFYAANAFLAAWIVQRVTSSIWASWLACFLALTAFPMIYISSQALTEPIFICFVLLALIMLGDFFTTGESSRLYSAALLIGISCLVRYVGLAFLATGGFAILVFSRTSCTARLRDAAKFGILGSFPLAIWVTRNLFSAGNAVNRTFSFHPPGLNDLLPAIDTAGYWLLPISIVENIPWLSRTVVALALLSIIWGLARKSYLRNHYIQLLAFWIAGYGSFLLVSMSLNDQPLYFDTRTLALPYMAVMMLALCIMTDLQEKRSMPPLGSRPAIAILLTLQIINGSVWLRQSYSDGIGFATEQWRTSELIGFVKNAREPLVFFSNAPDFLATLANKPAQMIPRKVNPDTYKPNEHYAAEFDSLREQLIKPNTVLVYFDDDNRLWYLPSPAELERNLPLQVIKTAREGIVYRWNGPRL